VDSPLTLTWSFKLAPVEINRPRSPELTTEKQQALEHFRQRVHELTLNGGITSVTVRNVVRAMREHPQFSREVLQVLVDESSALRETAPGVSLLDLE
jgi:hypothetical protein